MWQKKLFLRELKSPLSFQVSTQTAAAVDTHIGIEYATNEDAYDQNGCHPSANNDTRYHAKILLHARKRGWIGGRLTTWLARGLSRRPTCRLTSRLSRGLNCRLTCRLSSRSASWLPGWLPSRLTRWSSCWLTCWLASRLACWLTRWPPCWLSCGLCGWLTTWLPSWLDTWVPSGLA
jgi:hypothetical protein